MEACNHADDKSMWWGRCLLPHPKQWLPARPIRQNAAPVWDGGDHHSGSDASGSHPKWPRRRMVADSAIAIGKDRKIDYPLQTVVAGELMESVRAARFSDPVS